MAEQNDARSIGSVLSEMREYAALRAAMLARSGIRTAVHPQPWSGTQYARVLACRYLPQAIPANAEMTNGSRSST